MHKFSRSRIKLVRGASVLAVSAGLMVATPAFAQALSGVAGHVDGATPGTTVTATDVDTGQKIEAKIGKDGDYRILGLRPGTYTISTGGSSETVSVPIGQTVTVDLGAESKTDVVVTAGHTRDVTSATVSTSVSPAQIELLPQNNRNFLNFAALAPGVSVSPGNVQVQAGGVSPDGINVFIDGLSYKNLVNHGGVQGQNFSQGNPFPQLAVQEFRVDVQNPKAEFENVESAVIDTATKTGGTKYHGDAFIEYQPSDFINRPFFDRQNTGPKPAFNRKQFGGDIGGPIIKNLLHVYFAYEGVRNNLGSSAIQLFQNIPAAALTQTDRDLITQFNGSQPQNFQQDLYFGKLTLYPTSRDVVNASVYARVESNLNDFGGNAVPSHGRVLTNDVRTYELFWTHHGDNWVNQFIAAYNTVANGTPRNSQGPEILLTDGQSTNAVQAQLGAHFFIQNDRQKSLIFKDNFTYSFSGGHTFKAGIKLQFNKLNRLVDAFGNGTYFFDARTYSGFDTSTPYAGQISIAPIQPYKADDNQVGLYVQDEWKPDEHWTIYGGLRWDFEDNAKGESFVTPDNVATALRNYQPWRAAGINPEDYISTGKNRSPFYGAIQPRFQISYDVKGDRDLVVFAGYGRYYDRSLFIDAAIEAITQLYSTNVRLFANTVAGGVIPRDVNALRTLALGSGAQGSDIFLLNNKTKTPFTDQFDIGVRKRFGQVQTALTVSYVKARNIFQYVRGNRLPDGSFPTFTGPDFPNGIPVVLDTFPANGLLPGFTGKLDIGQNNGEAHTFSIYFQADKPYTQSSGWGFTNAFTFTIPRTNDGTEIVNVDEFFAGPDVRQFGTQFVRGVERWKYVGTGIVRIPFNIKFSTIVTLSSGPSFGSVYGFGVPASGLTNTACCIADLAGVRYPKKFFGYANIDFQVEKSFKLFGSHELTATFSAFNIFDFVNRDYQSWGAGFRAYDAATNTFGQPSGQENATVANSSRRFQAGLRYKF